jgi:hypothetical protein
MPIKGTVYVKFVLEVLSCLLAAGWAVGDAVDWPYAVVTS